ncbi:DUF2161 domain-containing phosphodiesterase [Ponticoccus alexandrii]|uniref:Uncharacterized protein n=1 Tax=Ponticoccus alexandrii TaxID=1943633 RepID=A0ABX7F737_9RHOB|nr:DUF2161 family putative PD-(D/E)XK-type phosphodiesterase [Ponticoccus alexandrii]ETA49676.1 hypothetical protein P279_23435 [Rhodobacteraceae bacterium PD-2]QRF65513.1 hypothetical protein GQA70_03775 [Ponticoccus alexandrii]
MRRESELYGPVKALLEEQGYRVKGEVGAADLVAIRGDEPPVIVELKLRFALAVYTQAVARLALTDTVYIAVGRPTGKLAARAVKDNTALCRRLGLGLITVRADGHVEVHCDPGPYAPRKNKRAQVRLLREFDRLRGDPNDGGATRHGIVTGYRQDSLACAAHLAEHGQSRGRDVVAATGVKQATTIMRDNHYGWFEKVEKGVYALTQTGTEGLAHWAYSWDEGEGQA